MSIVPLLLGELLDRRFSSLDDILDQHFGLGLPGELGGLTPVQDSLLRMPLRSGYLRPWRHLQPRESGVSSMVDSADQFKVNLDVQQFKPEELKVTIQNGYLVVEAKHEERSDEHGFISRQFTRRYKIPQDIDQVALKSHLSSDGVLTLEAPKIKRRDEPRVVEIPITQTNLPLRVRDSAVQDGPATKSPPN